MSGSGSGENVRKFVVERKDTDSVDLSILEENTEMTEEFLYKKCSLDIHKLSSLPTQCLQRKKGGSNFSRVVYIPSTIIGNHHCIYFANRPHFNLQNHIDLGCTFRRLHCDQIHTKGNFKSIIALYNLTFFSYICCNYAY